MLMEYRKAALERTRAVEGASGCVTWMLSDGRPWLHVVKG